MTRASIIIVSRNGEPYLGNCLAALSSQVSSDDEIIVVDNGSADRSVALVREQFPQIRLIESEHHLGFAGGCNAGIKAASGQNLILLDQGVTVQSDWLAAMLEALRPPEIGIAGCKLVSPEGAVLRAGGVISHPLAHTSSQSQSDRRCQVDYVSGTAMGTRRSVLDKIGLLDEGFFPACYEDADLCFRAKAAGYRVIYTPDAVGVVHSSEPAERETAEYHRWMGRGRLRFVLKHYTAKQFHDEFVPAERAWLAALPGLEIRQGLRRAYLDTVLSLRDVPKSGALAEEGGEEAVAEALIGLRQVLVGFPQGSRQAAPGLLVELPWEPPRSRIPIVGTSIARLRGLCDSVWRLQEKLAVVQGTGRRPNR